MDYWICQGTVPYTQPFHTHSKAMENYIVGQVNEQVVLSGKCLRLPYDYSDMTLQVLYYYKTYQKVHYYFKIVAAINKSIRYVLSTKVVASDRQGKSTLERWEVLHTSTLIQVDLTKKT